MKLCAKYKYSALITTALLAVAVSGCTRTTLDPVDNLTGKTKEANIRLETKAQTAINEGRSNEALKAYENLFKRSPVLTEEILVNYSQLLRHSGNPKTAINIIDKYAIKDDGTLAKPFTTATLNELASNYIEDGQFEKAVDIASKIIDNPALFDFHASSYNILGIAFDAQGQHEIAEGNFRKALSGWKGDSTSVKNNLALCLASQGKFDEALMFLREALIAAPNKDEIAKNIEIISSIRESVIAKPKQ